MATSILQDAMPPPSPDHPGPAARFRPYASSKHTVTRGRYITSNDPRGYLPVYEYPLNGQWLMVDSDNGYVLWTGIWKALGNTKADIMKMVDCQPELAPKLRRVRGGYLKIQGTWMPYEIALRLARRVAWPIREDLVPLFGPTFPSTCLAPDQPGYGQLASTGRRKSRRTTNPNPVVQARPSSAAPFETQPTHRLPSPYTAEPPSAAYMHSYPQLPVPYRNTPSYPQQSGRKHHRQQGYSPYPFPSDIHPHGHTHGPPQNPNLVPRARPIENPNPTSPRTPRAPFLAHYRTHDREHDGLIHLPPLSSLGYPLPLPPPIQTSFGGGPPNGILGPPSANSSTTNAPPGSTYSLPPISSLDSPGSGTGPDGSSAVLRRLRLDDEHVHLHRRDLDARAATLHKAAYSESAFTLPSPQELRRRRSISAPPLNAYGGGGSSAGDAFLPTAIHDTEREIGVGQSRGLQSEISTLQQDPRPESIGYFNPYAPASSASYGQYVPQYEHPRAAPETQPQSYQQPHPRSPLLGQTVYHDTGAPQWPTTLQFPPPNSGPGPGPSYSYEITARASGSSSHQRHASWAQPRHPFMPADNIESKATSPTRMPSRPW